MRRKMLPRCSIFSCRSLLNFSTLQWFFWLQLKFFLHFHPAPRYNVKTVTNDHITQLNPTLIGFTSTLSGGFGLTSVWILWIETPRSCATYGSTNMFNMCNIWILCFEMPRCCATLLGLVLRWRCNREWASWSKWDPRCWF